jgi:Spy/CpxP family protein refolding chaperone
MKSEPDPRSDFMNAHLTTRKTFLAAAAVAFGLLGHPLLSQAFDGDHSQQPGHQCQRSGGAHEGWGRLAERLHLTKAQRQSVNAIEDKYRPQLRDMRQSLADNRQALNKMDAADPKLPEAAAAQGKAIADMIVARKTMRAEMSQVLTEEQRQTLGKLLEQRRQHHHHEMKQS